MDNYKKRVVDDLLIRKLKGKGAVLIRSARLLWENDNG